MKPPPTARSPFGSRASAATPTCEPVVRPLNGAHAVPFQRIKGCTTVLPGAVHVPPASSSPLGDASSALTPTMPAPSADHVLVAGSHVATPYAATLPATMNEPATTTRDGSGPEPSGSQS